MNSNLENFLDPKLFSFEAFEEKRSLHYPDASEKFNEFDFPDHNQSQKHQKENGQKLDGQRNYGDCGLLEGENDGKSWKREEIIILFDFYLHQGPRWTDLSRVFSGKSENCIKNKFYGSVRKLLRKINSIGKKKIPKFSKQIKYESVVRVLEVQDSNLALNQALMNQSQCLRKNIVQFCKRDEEEQNQEEITQFVEKLHKFNLSSRCYRLKKGIKRKIMPQKHATQAQILSSLSDQKKEAALIDKITFLKSLLQSNFHNHQGRTKENCVSFQMGKTFQSKEQMPKETKKEFTNVQFPEKTQLVNSTSNLVQPDLEDQAFQILGLSFRPQGQIIKEFF